jgi:hypothetical protein
MRAKPARADPGKSGVQKPLCPSTAADAGVEEMHLSGIVGADGLVAHLLTPLPVNDDFLAEVQAKGRPEDRFRFSAPCVEKRCENWAGGQCGLIGRIRAALPEPQATAALPPCGIRARCRWWLQDGAAACAVCPQVTYNP